MFVLLTACKRQTAYFNYEHTPEAGWEKNDVLSFQTAPLEEGYYHEEIGIRISGAYPFRGLTLIIDQATKDGQELRSDTLNCNLIDKRGYATGRGINEYQYLLPLTTLHVDHDEALHITIRHDMKREILPGITDIGVRLTKTKEVKSAAGYDPHRGAGR